MVKTCLYTEAANEILNLGGGKISRGLGPGPFFLRDFRPCHLFVVPLHRMKHFTQSWGQQNPAARGTALFAITVKGGPRN